jgi:hypothetical protein
VLELLHVRLLIKYPVSLALPKAHPHANKPEIPLSLLKEEPFIRLNRMHSKILCHNSQSHKNLA